MQRWEAATMVQREVEESSSHVPGVRLGEEDMLGRTLVVSHKKHSFSCLKKPAVPWPLSGCAMVWYSVSSVAQCYLSCFDRK